MEPERKPVELTGGRRKILLGAWWIVLVCGVWLAFAWPFHAYRGYDVCYPTDPWSSDAGNGATLAMGLFAIGAAVWALVCRNRETHAVAAAALLVELPTCVMERVTMSVFWTRKNECPEHIWQSWIVEPTRTAVSVVTFAGIALLILGFVLNELEGGRASLPTARAR